MSIREAIKDTITRPGFMGGGRMPRDYQDTHPHIRPVNPHAGERYHQPDIPPTNLSKEMLDEWWAMRQGAEALHELPMEGKARVINWWIEHYHLTTIFHRLAVAEIPQEREE